MNTFVIVNATERIAMQADDELEEQSLGIGGLTVVSVNDAADLSLLDVTCGKIGSPSFGEILFLGSGIGDELGDEADRVGVFVFGKTSYFVRKIEASH